MKDDSQDNSPRVRSVRYAVLSLAALVVLSLGFAFVPAEKPAPAQPPFTELARAAALKDAMDLRAAGMELAAADTADAASVEPVVTLLTIQARALLAPAAGEGQSVAETAASAAASPAAAPASGPPSPATAPAPASARAPDGLAGLASALMASGTKRIKDAQEADGGMARLLAGAGTAQLLASARLAGAAGAPVPSTDPAPAASLPVPAETGPSCPAVPPAESTGSGGAGSRGTGSGGTGPGGTGPGAALAAALAAEQQAAYGYQAALPRLAAADAGTALAYLGQHDDLLEGAEARLRLLCATAAPQQPGYALDARFLAAPAAGLGRLEAATMAAYGDLVALSQGTVRAWALTALQSAARRASHWGADAGPVPGLPLDVDQLPGLPSAPAQVPSPAAT